MIGIDSSAIIDFLKGNTQVGPYLLKGCVAEISYFEVMRGAANTAVVEDFYSRLPNHALNKTVMRRACEIYSHCEKTGNRVPLFDALIAASFLQNGISTILTNDKHFKQIKGLKVVGY